MKQSQSWLDAISLLAGSNVPRSDRPNERLYLIETWQKPKPQSHFLSFQAVRLLYARMKS